MEKLHPGARWSFRLRVYFGFFPFLIFALFFSIALSAQVSGAYFIFIFFFMFLIAVIIISEIYARMAYNRWFYEFTNEGLKIERGIIWKKYTSIPYERVQNVNMNRGIIARIFGFSTLDIETAGQSGFGSSGFQFKFGRRGHQQYRSEGHIPAVSMEAAEKIRDFLIKKISKRK